MAEPIRVDAVSRRTVLKGIAGAAGLVSIPAIIAACSTAGSVDRRERAARRHVGRQRAGRVGRRQRRRRLRDVRFELLEPGHRHEGACRPSSTRSRPRPASTVKVNTVDHNTFQDQISQLPQGTPDDRSRGSPAIRMRSSPTRASTPRSTTCGTRSRANFTDALQGASPATTASSTSASRSTTTRGPSSTARASSPTRATRSPTTWDDFKALCDEDADRRPDPDRLRRQGRLARAWARSTSSTCGSTATTSTST